MLRQLLVLFLVLNTIWSFAGSVIPQKSESNGNKLNGAPNSALPGIIYSYVDFDFNSSSGANFNRFSGHSNIVGAGANQLKLFKDVTAGLFFYHIDTTSMSHTNIAPNPETLYRADTKNDTILAHIMKPLKKGFFIDGGIGYGANQTTLNGMLYVPNAVPFRGYAKYDYNNWLANATLFYQHQIKAIVISAFVQGLYTQSDIGGYTQYFSNVLLPTAIAPLTTKITYAIENVHLRYQSNSAFSPFISAGLVQVIDYNQSRAAVTGPVNGSLPQLALNRDGYRIGGGFGIHHKKAAVRVEYRYYRATRQFHSDQLMLNLTYLLD